jgi:hypothetical protein
VYYFARSTPFKIRKQKHKKERKKKREENKERNKAILDIYI